MKRIRMIAMMTLLAAATASGGEILFVEATKMKGKGNLSLTGSLGDVMKESAQAALSYARTHAGKLGIEIRLFSQNDFNSHFWNVNFFLQPILTWTV